MNLFKKKKKKICGKDPISQAIPATQLEKKHIPGSDQVGAWAALQLGLRAAFITAARSEECQESPSQCSAKLLPHPDLSSWLCGLNV